MLRPLSITTKPLPTELYRHDIARWRRADMQLGGFGAIGLLICTLLPSTSAYDQRVFVVAAALSLVMVAIISPMRGNREVWFTPVSIGLNLAFVTGLVASLEHTGAFALFYILPLLSGAMLLTTRASVALGVVTLGLCAVALAVRPAGFDTLMWLNIVVVNVGVTTAVRGLRAGRDALFRDLGRVADTDGLTGVLNRSAFERTAARVLDRAAHDGEPLAAVLFDIDHFKRINDKHGHAAGDTALRSFAATLAEQARPSDVIGRVGGEEFAVILPGARESDAERFAVRVADALRHAELGDQVRVTVSAGVVAHTGETLEALFRYADMALYAAKAAGRDRVVVHGAAVAA